MAKVATKEKIVDGVVFPPNISDFHCQLWLARYASVLESDPCWRPSGIRGAPYCGAGKFSHYHRLIESILPSFEWQDNSEVLVKACCEHSSVAACGGAATGKSAGVGAYAFTWAFVGGPETPLNKNGFEDSAVLVASTTIGAALQRIWKNISFNYSEAQGRIGKIGETVILGKPKPEIRATPKSFAEGLFVVAVAQGDIQKAINELKGRHPPRILLIGDETDSISEAVVEVQDNLRSGANEFQTIWLGNLPSMFNPLGKIMEPAVNTPVSEACGTEWTSSTGVRCLRFDGENSPNIRDNGKWRGLMKQSDIDAILKRNHGVKGQQYWIMVKGLPPPEGVDDTVLSEATLNRFHVREEVTWMRDFTMSASLDPGFVGDPCLLRSFKRGLDKEGNLRLLLDEELAIPVDAADTVNPAEYQIAAKAKAWCLSRGILPQEFIIDSTGIGRGTASVLQREWSPAIEICSFGGAATERPVSHEDLRPSKDEYDRLVTELWFSIREFIMADMVRGMDNQTARELCSRKFEIKGTGSGKRTSIEKKEDMKGRGIASPNHGDCMALYCELLRRKGIGAAQQGQTVSTNDEAQAEADSYDFEEVYEQTY